MSKINFTKEHYNTMLMLATDMLLSNRVVTTSIGTPLNICDLLHTTTINSLNKIRLSLSKKIESFESVDEWVTTDGSQKELEVTKAQKELVNLIIGYKRYNIQLVEDRNKKQFLQNQLIELKESQKTPEDKIKELEDEINSLGDITPNF